jgi:hypothetical protein
MGLGKAIWYLLALNKIAGVLRHRPLEADDFEVICIRTMLC